MIRWTHAYGAVVPNGHDLAGSFVTLLAIDSMIPPADVPTTTGEAPNVVYAYLGSFDHDPTSAEIAALRPAEFRDLP
jgi:hypothetical protein